MVKAGLLTGPKRGYVAITQRGIDLLATKPEMVNVAVLSQYREFAAWKQKPTTKGTTTGTGDENPEESLYGAYGSWRATIEADLLERLQSESFPWQSFERLVVGRQGCLTEPTCGTCSPADYTPSRCA
jgi:restriction system protein